MKLEVEYEQKAADVFIVRLNGVLNNDTYPQFEKPIEAILEKKPHIIVLDMQRLSYLSSAGIRVILKARNALKKYDGKIVYMHLQPQIKKVFDIINALPSMSVFTSVRELDDYLDTMQRTAAGRK